MQLPAAQYMAGASADADDDADKDYIAFAAPPSVELVTLNYDWLTKEQESLSLPLDFVPPPRFAHLCTHVHAQRHSLSVFSPSEHCCRLSRKGLVT